MERIKIQQLVDEFQLIVMAGSNGLENMINSTDIHRPGLELTGFFKHFPNERIQVLGKQEMSYLKLLTDVKQNLRIARIVSELPPCFIITRGQESIVHLVEHCNIYNIPLLQTEEKTTNFIAKLSNYLDRSLAEELGIHGVCLNVFGVGVLLRGESGIGKSETALSLILKGHRLISDDLVILKRIGQSIIGTHNYLNRELLSLRGIGLVNVCRLYGASSFQEETKIILDIALSPWDESTTYNTLFNEEVYVDYLGVNIKHLIIPIRPGRDIATLIEVAVNNNKLKEKGYNAFKELEKRMLNQK
jgi:HPr kinase/phosphorylase